MCGIVGYVGPRDVRELLLAGLEKLEYRGYDSAGISILNGTGVDSVRAVGSLQDLHRAIGADAAAAGEEKASASDHEAVVNGHGGIHTGIGHTRWATHGKVTVENAHPHNDPADRVHIAMNGIVENYVKLRDDLKQAGATFSSETDAEVIAHLIAHYYDGDLVEATRLAYNDLRGHYAFVAVCADEPGVIVGARNEAPLIVGRGNGEQFLGSAIPAFMKHTTRVQYINDHELVVLRPEGVRFITSDGTPLEREVTEVDWDVDTAEKQGYESFMLKEIHEQPEAIADTIGERAVAGDGIDLGQLGTIDDGTLRHVDRIVIAACGSSYHAALVGKYVIEEWARVPVEVEIASEYRYRNPVVGAGDLVVGISQSGETADTLAALREARKQGARVLAVSNVMGSQITRDSDGVLYTRAGMEIGVAATKTFVSQVMVMYLLALRLAQLRQTCAPEQLKSLIADLKHVPNLISQMLEAGVEQIERIAEDLHQCEFFMYIGRHLGVPIAYEGALKLKEISYIATDAYAAGEMKHGPIALLDETTPVIAVATDGPVLEKVISNIQEVRARGARVIAIASEGSSAIDGHADEVIRVPQAHWMLSPLLAVVPLQLLAYHIARGRGLNVDRPRNLAKTVTVE